MGAHLDLADHLQPRPGLHGAVRRGGQQLRRVLRPPGPWILCISSHSEALDSDIYSPFTVSSMPCQISPELLNATIL